MKKLNYFFISALAVLTLTPASMNAQCSFTPDAFPGQAADRTEEEVSATVHVGEYGQATKARISNLVSSNMSAVQTYGSNAVFFVGVGTSDVTYTEIVIDGRTQCQTNHTIHYTVDKGTPVAGFFGQDGTAVTEYTVTLSSGGGDEGSADGGAAGGGSSSYYYTPTGSVKIKAYQRAGFIDQAVAANQLTFNSTNPAVASINANGVVSINGLGTTTISLSWGGNDNWNGAAASYQLNVKQNVSMSFNPMTVIDTLGNPHQQPVLTVNPAVSPIHYSSSKPEVASVDANTGVVTLNGRGNAIITASFDGNEQYGARQAQYYITVVKKDPGLSFDVDTARAEVGVPFTPPTLNNPHNVSVDKWNSGNSSIAEVNEATGAVTIKSAGTVTIYCETNEDATYARGMVTYVLVVRTTGVRVLGQLVTSLNADDVLGDGKVSYDIPSRTLYLHGWNIDVASMSSDIKDGVIKDETGPVLNVTLDGNSSILNATRCLVSVPSNAAMLIRSQSKKDSLTLSATNTTIYTNIAKIHECLLFATAQTRGIWTTFELAISKYGHVFAAGNVMAIQAPNFIKGEGGIGGIDILTPGVEYKSGTFITTSGQKTGGPALRVEIGKVPMPISKDSVTRISFAEQDPEDQDNVVFSAGRNDAYNESTRQLEISSAFTDANITEAMDTLVPGSSAWVSQLPGTLIVDVPEGEGNFEIKCQTEEGYSLQVKIDGKDGVESISQSSLGWATVSYNVTEQTHVIVYLREPASTPSPAKRHAATSAVGGYIEAINIMPKDAPTAISVFSADEPDKARKILHDGLFYILRDGKAYDVNGRKQ